MGDITGNGCRQVQVILCGVFGTKFLSRHVARIASRYMARVLCHRTPSRWRYRNAETEVFENAQKSGRRSQLNRCVDFRIDTATTPSYSGLFVSFRWHDLPPPLCPTGWGFQASQCKFYGETARGCLRGSNEAQNLIPWPRMVFMGRFAPRKGFGRNDVHAAACGYGFKTGSSR